MALPKGGSLDQRNVEFGSDDGGLRVWYLEKKWYLENKVIESPWRRKLLVLFMEWFWRKD